MPSNHYAQIRYRALDKCLRNRNKKYYIKDLIEECCKALYEQAGISDGVHKRQVWKDLNTIECDYGVTIEHIRDGQRMYFRYEDPDFSIMNQDLSDEEVQKLKETVFMLSRFEGMPQKVWIGEFLTTLEDKFKIRGESQSVIGLAENEFYYGLEHITPLFNAIVNHQPLTIYYSTFGGADLCWNIHPYYLKQFNNRWFLFGHNHDMGKITNMALDRIRRIEFASGIDYIPNTDIDFNGEFFEDVIGVTVNDSPVERIFLKVNPSRYPYITTKPLHGSQKTVDKDKCILSIEVKPNPELFTLLMSFGNDIEVLEPLWLREEFANRVKQMYQSYFKN